MVSLLGALVGFLGAIFPELIKVWRSGSEQKHELAMLEIQLRASRQRSFHRMQEIGIGAEIAERNILYRTYRTGIRWVDALNGTVRPVIAYGFFILYAGIKVSQIANGLYWKLWTEEDQAVFAGIISFYFGQRAMLKTSGRV